MIAPGVAKRGLFHAWPAQYEPPFDVRLYGNGARLVRRRRIFI